MRTFFLNRSTREENVSGETDNKIEQLVKLNAQGVPRIGGWLRLLTLGVVLTILKGAGDMAEAAGTIVTIEPEGYAAAGNLLWFRAIGSMCIVLVGVWLLFLLLKKRKAFVWTYIYSMIVINMLITVDIIWIILLANPAPPEIGLFIARLVLGYVATGLWIWYLLVSRRVSMTFSC